jgi:hypothetical protein
MSLIRLSYIRPLEVCRDGLAVLVWHRKGKCDYYLKTGGATESEKGKPSHYNSSLKYL